MFPIVYLSPVIETFLILLLGNPFLVRLFIRLFSNKRTLLTGPIGSGKTTFLKKISITEIPDGPSGSPRTYKVVKNCKFDKVTDLSGAESWLMQKFDERIKEYDNILFFFDVSEYVKDEKYRNDVNARIDFIHRHKTSSQKTLLIGTHIDKMSGNFEPMVGECFAGKSYQSMLDNIVYVNTTKKESYKSILNALED